MMRAMCGEKVAATKKTKQQMDMLGLKENIRWVRNSKWS